MLDETNMSDEEEHDGEVDTSQAELAQATVGLQRSVRVPTYMEGEVEPAPCAHTM